MEKTKTYILLKDLPNIPAGTVSTVDINGIFEFVGSNGYSYFYTASDMTDPNWFSEVFDYGSETDSCPEDFCDYCCDLQDDLDAAYQEISDLTAELDATADELDATCAELDEVLGELSDLKYQMAVTEPSTSNETLKEFTELLRSSVDTVFIVSELARLGLVPISSVQQALDSLYIINSRGPRQDGTPKN